MLIKDILTLIDGLPQAWNNIDAGVLIKSIAACRDNIFIRGIIGAHISVRNSITKLLLSIYNPPATGNPIKVRICNVPMKATFNFWLLCCNWEKAGYPIFQAISAIC